MGYFKIINLLGLIRPTGADCCPSIDSSDWVMPECMPPNCDFDNCTVDQCTTGAVDTHTCYTRDMCTEVDYGGRCRLADQCGTDLDRCAGLDLPCNVDQCKTSDQCLGSDMPFCGFIDINPGGGCNMFDGQVGCKS